MFCVVGDGTGVQRRRVVAGVGGGVGLGDALFLTGLALRAPSVTQGRDDEDGGQRHHAKAQQGLRQRGDPLLEAVEQTGEALADLDLGLRAVGHRPGAGEVDHEDAHRGEGGRHHDVDRVGGQDPAAELQPDGACL
ncbi:hypothetical protein [Ornithinimicrobium kibberense]|uniref:hypothetical protein n=1 Tax=Ornithinimicrobium kibberense TaxID=282060 RepID=UPI0036149C47